jgi:hypothetical protein
MPGIDYHEFKRRVPLKNVLIILGVPFTGLRDHRQRGRCPLGCSTDPRGCTFNLETNLWYCHRCNAGGAALDLYMKLKRKSIVEAATELCRLLRVDIPWKARRPSRRRESAYERSDPPNDDKEDAGANDDDG